jgi:hypothetical protein
MWFWAANTVSSAQPPLPTILEVLCYLSSLGNQQVLERREPYFFMATSLGRLYFASIQHPSMLRNPERKPAHGCLALRKDPPIGLQTGSRTRTCTSFINSTYICRLLGEDIPRNQHTQQYTCNQGSSVTLANKTPACILAPIDQRHTRRSSPLRRPLRSRWTRTTIR